MERASLIRESGVMAEDPNRTPVSPKSGILESSNLIHYDSLPSHIFFTIVSIVFCAPLGIMALLQAIKVNSLSMTDLPAARRASELAAQFSLLAVVVGTHMGVLLGTCAILYVYQ